MRCRLFAGIALFLCACGPQRLEEVSCPPEGTQLSYANFGAEFLGKHCQNCHGGVGRDRNGAPSAFDFGTAEDARAHSARIFVRSAGPNTTMPPGPEDPSMEERSALSEWLACGAP